MKKSMVLLNGRPSILSSLSRIRCNSHALPFRRASFGLVLLGLVLFLGFLGFLVGSDPFLFLDWNSVDLATTTTTLLLVGSCSKEDDPLFLPLFFLTGADAFFLPSPPDKYPNSISSSRRLGQGEGGGTANNRGEAPSGSLSAASRYTMRVAPALSVRVSDPTISYA